MCIRDRPLPVWPTLFPNTALFPKMPCPKQTAVKIPPAWPTSFSRASGLAPAAAMSRSCRPYSFSFREMRLATVSYTHLDVYKRQKIYLPVSVRADVTGSVAMNTAPKQKPPSTRCSYLSLIHISLVDVLIIIHRIFRNLNLSIRTRNEIHVLAFGQFNDELFDERSHILVGDNLRCV